MSNLTDYCGRASHRAACATLLSAAIAVWPAVADTRAFAVATVSATVHVPVTVRMAFGDAVMPSVDAANRRAYVLRTRRVTGDAGQTLRYVFVDFE